MTPNEERTVRTSYTRSLILWAISARSLHRSAITRETGLNASSVSTHINALMATGLIFKDGDVPTRGRRAPCYRAKQPHPKPVEHLRGTGKKTSEVKAVIADAIKGQPMTCRDIAALTGLELTRVYGCITYWRRSGRRAFKVHSWAYEEGQGVGYLPRYASGSAPDAPKPSVSRRERDAAWRDRNRAAVRVKQAVSRGTVGAVDPFQHLLQLAGATLSAAKRRTDERKRQQLEVAA